MMIHQGDLFDVLPTFEASSIDACVTDPPYDLAFMGKRWDKTGVAFRPETWREVFRVLKPGAYLVACGGTRTSHRMTCAIEDAGFVIRDAFAWLYGQGFPKSKNLGHGRGTGLKPGYEPIALAWKPVEGSITANVEQWGTGALNIDACRIGTTKDVPSSGSAAGSVCYGKRGPRTMDMSGFDPNIGRWPANVILDEDAADVLDQMTGEMRAGEYPATANASIGYHGGTTGWSGRDRVVLDVGGASRFFYVAKPSREERDYGCDDLSRTSAASITGRKIGSAGLQNPRAGIRAGSMDRDPLERAARNIHPTVKPVELMRWLVKLVTPINGTVLDPFLGSGTTGMACRYEHRGFIGIEREAEYVAIATRRIAAVAPLFGESESDIAGEQEAE
jgi:site-specific DNA-methyltransferase (adenine-specific)